MAFTLNRRDYKPNELSTATYLPRFSRKTAKLGTFYNNRLFSKMYTVRSYENQYWCSTHLQHFVLILFELDLNIRLLYKPEYGLYNFATYCQLYGRKIKNLETSVDKRWQMRHFTRDTILWNVNCNPFTFFPTTSISKLHKQHVHHPLRILVDYKLLLETLE